MINLYNEMIRRQKEIFTKTQQEKLKNTPVCIIGCGGLGGSVIEQLIRVGFENITIVDEDVFDKTNMNRQLRSNIETINQSKAEITQDYVHKINPEAKIKAYNIKVDKDNISDIIGDIEIVIDAVDNIYTRVIISRYTQKNDITFIHAAVEQMSGQLTTFIPGCPSYEELFHMKSKDMTQDELEDYYNGISFKKPQIIGTTAAIFGCLEVNEAIKHILDLDNKIIAPSIFQWDVFDPLSADIISL